MGKSQKGLEDMLFKARPLRVNVCPELGILARVMMACA
jgi:hypothetical protein